MALTFPDFEPTFPQECWTLPYILEHQARSRPHAPFLQWTDSGIPLSFEQVNREVNRLAHGFAEIGVSKGDKIAIFLPNCLEYPLIWFALNKLGAAEVTIGNDFKAQFLLHPLKLSRSTMIVTNEELIGRLAAMEDDLPDLTRIILLSDKATSALAAQAFRRVTVSAYEDLMSERETNPGIDIHPRDIGAVLFTSGTTGPSKAVMMPHSQLYFFAEELIQVTRLSDQDVYMTGFPFFHANAQLESIYPALVVGIRCVLYEKFSASEWMSRIRRSGATVTNLLGATMSFVVSQPEQADDADNPLRCIFAAPTPANLCSILKSRYNIDEITTGFGQTEISMPFLKPFGVTPPDDSCGVELSQWFDVVLAHPVTGKFLDGPATGELLVRHKVPGTISDGFLGMPEKTVEAWRDLWFHTGDAMRRDENGWYFFVDRLKDTLRRRGENISSFEVENTVREFPAVAECAVVGVPADEEGGEDEVMVFIVPRAGHDIDPGALLDFCKARMPKFALPRFIEVLPRLPETPSGKVQKAKLRERGISESTWDSKAPATV